MAFGEILQIHLLHEGIYMNVIQPYFVLNTTSYYKHSMRSMGISHFYEFVCDLEDAPDTVVVPDGTVDVIFCCDLESPDAVAYGSVLCAQEQMFEAGKRYFGVRFMPGAVRVFGDAGAEDIVANTIKISDLSGMSEAIERIAGAPDLAARIDIFVRYIYPVIGLNAASGDNSGILAGQILSQINIAKGDLTMKDLEDELHYSQRHMNRVFLSQTGFTIKKFCRYVRFQNLLGILKDNKTFTILEASEEAGYYDQNHLQKEFKEFAKTTPKFFKDMLKQVHYSDRIIKK